MRPRRLLPFFLLCTVGLSLSLPAQRVRWEPPGGSFAIGQTSSLSLIFEDCEPAGELRLPEIANLTLGQPHRGEQSSFNVVNGQASRSKTVYFTYQVRPASRDTIRIPAFTVQTNEGPMRVAPATFEVGDATVGGSSVPLEMAANSRLSVGARPLWAGEVVPVTYVLSVANRFPANLGSGPEWDPSPLVIEEWSKPEPGSAMLNGEARSTVSYRTRGYVREPGSHTLQPVNQLVNLRVPATGFNIFQSFQAEQYAITSNTPQLVVRRLPAPAPAGFNGAVGAFRLSSRVVPEQAAVGEPITWTLELEGTGNWPDIPGLPSREVSRDFRIVQPEARRTLADDTLFQANLAEDVVLIPTKPGTYRLGPVTWSYFDPAAGAYRTLTTEPTTVTITDRAAASPDAEGRPAAGSGRPDDAPTVRAAPAPAAPARIPRDPLPPARPAPIPWQTASLLGAGAALLSLIPLCWLALAWQRAVTTDAGRAARQARARLRLTLAGLRAAPDRQRRDELLQQWQRDAATLSGIPHAVPGPGAFRADPAWVRLWSESDRALYGAESALPADWTSRAGEALSRRRAPRFRPTTLFRPANLLPLLALALLGPALVAPSRADPAREAYDRGEFAEAGQVWRQRLAETPADWAAHHNLALALAQQQQWAEAAAHAITAFVQHPSDPSVRWHYEYALGRAGYSPSALSGFTEPDARHRLARVLSPARWQQVLLGAMAFVALAGVVVLLRMYRPGARRALGRVAGFAGGAALLLALAAALSLPCFGPTADPRAVLIWKAVPLRSLPTDLAAEQQTSTLPAGSVAIVDKSFLSWRRLAFSNGQTGWVRRDDYVGLWAAP